MKYIKIVKVGGVRKIKCQRKDGEIKNYKAKEAVVDYVKENFKDGDALIAEFTEGVIVKATKYKPGGNSGGGGYKKPGGYGTVAQGNFDNQSAVKSAVDALKGIEGVTVKNYKGILEDLIELCLGKITGKAATTKSAVSETEEELPEEEEDI